MMVQDDLEIVARMMSAQGRRLSRANEPITQLTQQLKTAHARKVEVSDDRIDRVFVKPHAQRA